MRATSSDPEVPGTAFFSTDKIKSFKAAFPFDVNVLMKERKLNAPTAITAVANASKALTAVLTDDRDQTDLEL